MASLKDRIGYGDGFQGSRAVEFLPLVADVVGWIGLFVCAVGFLLLQRILRNDETQAERGERRL